MQLSNIKSIVPLGYNRTRTVVWSDMRRRSPKEIGDYSGVNAPRLAPATLFGQQELDYDKLAKFFVCSDLVWTCISYVARTSALAQLEVKKRSNNAFVTDEEHPFTRMLKMPNEDMTQYDFWEAWKTHHLLYGRFCCLLVRESAATLYAEYRNQLVARNEVTPQNLELAKFKAMEYALLDNESPVIGMLPVHPSILDAVFNSGEKKWQGYHYEYAPGRKALVDANNLINDPLYNPEIGGAGVSPTYMAFRWLRLDAAMNQQLAQFFENGAIPSMIVSLKRPQMGWTGGTDTPDNILNNMKQKWMERFSRRGTEPKTPAFVYGDIDVQEIEQRIDEMMSKGVFYEIQSRICALYGCPVEIFEVGLRYNSQRASAEQSQKNYFNTSIQPFHVRVKQKLSAIVLPTYGLPSNNEKLEWNYSDMGIAAFLEQERRKDVYQAWEKGLITRNTANTLLGFPLIEGDLGDDLYRITVTSDLNPYDGSKKPENPEENYALNPDVTDNRLRVAQPRAI